MSVVFPDSVICSWSCLPEMNESSVWGCSQRQADSTGVTNGLSLKTKPPLFSMSYFKDVSPLDGSRVSCLWKARGLKKTECTLWAIPRHLPPLLTPTQPKVMSHFLSSIFQEQPVMVSPKEKKKKKCLRPESAWLLHISNVQTQAATVCSYIFLPFITYVVGLLGNATAQKQTKDPQCVTLAWSRKSQNKLLSMIFTHVALLYPS